MKFSNLKLKSKIVLTLLCSMLIITLILSSFGLSLATNTIDANIKPYLKTLISIATKTTIKGVQLEDKSEIELALKDFTKHKHISLLKVFGKDGDELFNYRKNGLVDITNHALENLPKIEGELFDQMPIMVDNAQIGEIILGISIAKKAKLLSSTKIVFLIIFLLFSGIFPIIIQFLNKFTKSIINISNFSKKIADGDLTCRYSNKSSKEFGLLTASLNRIVENLKLADEKLIVEKLIIEKNVKKSDEQKAYLDDRINYMIEEMENFSKGDLTVTLKTDKNDSIAKLFNSFNKAGGNILKQIENACKAVEATLTASKQINSSSEEMATGAQEQITQANEITSSIEEMTQAIMETTQNAATAAEKSKNTGDIATAGGKAVENTIVGMNKIAEVVKQSADIVKELGNSSKQIGQTVKVIDDIADQTNLLALNAAIEAARAGEQGRGFAVVADEVKKLAERTTTATQEIAEMIKKIQVDTRGAVKSIDQGTEEVEKGKQLANKAGESLKLIIGSTAEVVEVVTQLAEANEEQSATSGQITKNIEAISSVTEESSIGLQQIAQTSKDLNQQTNNLQKLMSQFKINSKKGNYSIRANGLLIETS